MSFPVLRSETKEWKLCKGNIYDDCYVQCLGGDCDTLLMRMEKCGRRYERVYGYNYWRIVDSEAEHLIRLYRKFIKHCSWEEDTVKEYSLSSRKTRKAVMGMARPVTSVWALPSVRALFISLDEGRFRTYVMDVLGSVNVSYVG